MLLKSIHVKNFKCIKDSTPFTIDEKVTCLVGKNESGKTALLQSLEKLNPVDPTRANFSDLEYPRHKLNEYQEYIRSGGKPAEVLTTTWTLSTEDIADLETIVGPAAQQMATITISKDYSNETLFDFALDDKPVVDHLIASHELIGDEALPFRGAQTLAELRKKLGELLDPSQRQKRLLDTLNSKFGTKTLDNLVIDWLQSRLPKIAYFSEYLRMPGQISVDDVRQRQSNQTLEDGHKVFLALLNMINRTVDDLQRITEHERLKADLEGASNRLTREIFRYWTQNRYLRVQFLFEQSLPGDKPPFHQGWVVRTRIENTRHGVTTSFDQRSAGFVWFFSFLVWFSQVRRNYGENLIILLDEPAHTLHAKAQSDLLRYIEERLAPNYQVVYTTHSPFMIDPVNLLRARTVEDIYLEAKVGEPPIEEPDLGTKVGDDVLSTDKDTIFPLQACLGYEISQTLFVGENTILVEGPAEILYFEWFKRKLKLLGRTALDSRWVVCPCGGIDKVPAFISLFSGNRLHIAVVTDFAVSHRRRVQSLRESELLREGHVLTIDSYAGQPEADIEDMIGRECYVELVTRAYSLPPEHRLAATRPESAPTRVVKEIEEFFRTLPPEIANFDHYGPAEYLVQQGSNLEISGLDVALNRFEQIFKELNKMLA